MRTLFTCLMTALAAGISPSIVSATADAGSQGRSTETRSVREGAQTILRVPGSNGYTITIRGSAKSVKLVATKGHSAAVYDTARSLSDSYDLEASFGRFGMIAAKFVPQGNLTDENLPDHCRTSVGSLGKFGHFLGRIEFHGEEGFTEVKADHARGFAIPGRRLVCKRQTGGAHEEMQGPRRRPSLVSFTFPVKGSTTFWAGRNAFSRIDIPGVSLKLGTLPKKGIAFSAKSLASKDGVGITRVTATRGPLESFVIADATAKLSPPFPFSGIGKFDSCKVRWFGSLSVALPGDRIRRLTRSDVGNLTVLKPTQSC